jgi:hypothetical protein
MKIAFTLNTEASAHNCGNFCQMKGNLRVHLGAIPHRLMVPDVEGSRTVLFGEYGTPTPAMLLFSKIAMNSRPSDLTS